VHFDIITKETNKIQI